MPTIVQRSVVSAQKDYSKYREALRLDFWFSCAYCTITEVEAAAIGFCIDHYEPQARTPGLVNSYSNLMWSCQRCNSHKGDLPEPSHMNLGYRFIRVDKDDYLEHLAADGLRLKPLSPVGRYTHTMLYLNAAYLVRVRALRERGRLSKEAIAGGLRYLQSVPIDRLPVAMRSSFMALRKQMATQASIESLQLDAVLREIARSVNLDTDPAKTEHTAARREFLASLDAQIGLAK